jgi:hypothetical protein
MIDRRKNVIRTMTAKAREVDETAPAVGQIRVVTPKKMHALMREVGNPDSQGDEAFRMMYNFASESPRAMKIMHLICVNLRNLRTKFFKGLPCSRRKP